ncbi:zinc-ribbon domain-containing protein [Pedobacter sp. PAMC26386]|nr:zinc-ribbon domain-containing protein [Pedobacter sp. PAMC26386]
MIFFFGTRSKAILTILLKNLECLYCKQTDTVFLNIISTYAHLFWIPLFPVGKKKFTVCSHCRQTLAENQMPMEYKAAIAQENINAKVPVWQFAGLIIIGCLIVVPILFSAISALIHSI